RGNHGGTELTETGVGGQGHESLTRRRSDPDPNSVPSVTLWFDRSFCLLRLPWRSWRPWGLGVPPPGIDRAMPAARHSIVELDTCGGPLASTKMPGYPSVSKPPLGLFDSTESRMISE